MSSDVIVFKGREIPIIFDKGHDHHLLTPKYYSIMNKIQSREIESMDFVDAIDWFFNKDQRIPLSEKKSVDFITVSPDNRILCFEMSLSILTYENLFYLALKTGWYFYITGVRLSSSRIVSYTDNIVRHFSLDDIMKSWTVKNDDIITLVPVSSRRNAVSFLLRIGKINLLLDAGFNRTRRNPTITRTLEKHTNKIDAVFLSHSHFDHCSGLADVIDNHPNSLVLASSTTLDFYAYRNAETWTGENRSELELYLPDQIQDVISNSIEVKSGTRIGFQGGELEFFYAGHMPGALMVYIKANDFKVLYTGDFSFNDYSPIPGVESSSADLPEKVDFLIVDAASGSQSYPPRKQVFNELLAEVKKKVENGHQILIGADDASTAIVIYLALFKHFRDLQLKKAYRWRPRIIMGRGTLEYTKIIQERVEDIHPELHHRIENELTPFTSALTKFYTDEEDIFSWIKRKRVIFIFGLSDPKTGIIRDLVRRVGASDKNLIYLTGALRTPEAIELASGNNRITLAGKEFLNKAEVFNVKFPNAVLNLHADSHQIMNLVEVVQPTHICLFHATPRTMIPIRALLSKLDYVQSTVALEEGMEPLRLR
jgi:Cft2 family RNA processing exonuclease